jgi:hypothetical protein
MTAGEFTASRYSSEATGSSGILWTSDPFTTEDGSSPITPSSLTTDPNNNVYIGGTYPMIGGIDVMLSLITQLNGNGDLLGKIAGHLPPPLQLSNAIRLDTDSSSNLYGGFFKESTDFCSILKISTPGIAYPIVWGSSQANIVSSIVGGNDGTCWAGIGDNFIHFNTSGVVDFTVSFGATIETMGRSTHFVLA